MTTETQEAIETSAPQVQKPAFDGRYSLADNGEVFWQENVTNPLPGVRVGKIAKGQSVLSPAVIADDSARQAEVEAWLQFHLRDILAVLFALTETEGENILEGAAKEIGAVVFDHLGVVHRSEIEKFVPELTSEHRTALRRKRLKMGPVLVFMPDLVKPAAINLRGLLWGVWNGKALPMDKPADGRVSVTINPETVDRHYYRSIGYPVFGPKAIRIDMLDRVITDIYDSAKDWQFQAKHQYAEWLGCNIEDLYAVLESMGHYRIKSQPAQKTEPAEENTAEIVTTAEEKTDDQAEKNPEKNAEKPELSFFKLKKGKISERPKSFKPVKKIEDKKPVRAPKPKAKPKDNGPRVISVGLSKGERNDDDSPFAILKQLQNK